MNDDFEMHDFLLEDIEGRLAIITRPLFNGRPGIPIHVQAAAFSIFDLTADSCLKYKQSEFPPTLVEFLHAKDMCLSDVPKAESCTIGTVPVVYAYRNEQNGFYCGSGHPVSETYSKLKSLIRNIEDLINQTLTGEVRNHLSNAAIELRLALKEEKENGN